MMALQESGPFGVIETAFRAKRSDGRKLLVPFITAGMTDDWLDCVRAAAAAGADAIEIGIPFSDPIMDGPVIQQASTAALGRGTTPVTAMSDLALLGDIGVPLVAMTSYNIAFRAGHRRFARLLTDHGVAGTILPDMPLEESDDWLAVAAENGVETVLLAAPTSPSDRLARIASASRGWVYGVGTMGVTGERATLASTAGEIARRLTALTDRPVLIGVGVSNAEQAAEVAQSADGVIVGASLVRRILAGEGPLGVEAYMGELRDGIDSVRSNNSSQADNR
jgi:tryptophan synthase alpha chain